MDFKSKEGVRKTLRLEKKEGKFIIQRGFSDVILRDSICPPIHQTKESEAMKRNIGRDNEKYFLRNIEKYQENYLK